MSPRFSSHTGRLFALTLSLGAIPSCSAPEPSAAGAAGGSHPATAGTSGGGSRGAVDAGGAAGAGASSSGSGGLAPAGAGGNASVGGAGAGGTEGGTLGGLANGGNGAGGGLPDANAVHVFLLAGQSNATGQGYTKNYPPGFVINPDVQLYHSAEIVSSTGGNAWAPLRHASENADGCGDRFGPELGFGNTIQPFYPNRRLAIIKHAKSATNLVEQWAPGASPSDTAHFGPEFATFVATVNSGLKALTDQGLKPKVVGMLWQQGENDADLGGTAAAEYGRHLSALIRRVREQWNVPEMRFVYGFVYPKSNYGPGRDQVRAGQANVDQNSGSPLAVENAFVVETDDLQLRANDPKTCYANDLVHFGSAGQLELGKRMATKMHEHLTLP